VRILQWEMTHNDPLFKTLTMPLLLYYVDYLLSPIMSFTLTMWLCEYMRILQWK
jgi:hypothetical protein